MLKALDVDQQEVLMNQARWLMSVEYAYQNQAEPLQPNPAARAQFATQAREDVDAEFTTWLIEMSEAYFEAIIFTDTGDMDQPPASAELSEELRVKVCVDTRDFLLRNMADCLTAMTFDGYGPAQLGHDLWLTRNGHGSGFWDRKLGEVGERLTVAAKAMGECDVYEGDDGKLYAC